jgi:nitrite reductase (NADH) small subunit
MSEWTRSAASTTSRCWARAASRAPKALAVAVFRTADDKVFALLDRCPHKGGPLSQGIVFGEAWPARCTTGPSGWPTAVPGRPTRAARRALPCRVRDGQVYLDANELATHATDLTRPVAGRAARRSRH